MKKIEFRELVELFLTRIVYEIKKFGYVPNINFIFGDDGQLLFKDVAEHPFESEDYYTPSIR